MFWIVKKVDTVKSGISEQLDSEPCGITGLFSFAKASFYHKLHCTVEARKQSNFSCMDIIWASSHPLCVDNKTKGTSVHERG